MQKIRVITKTTDGKHIGARFDLCEVGKKLTVGGTVFDVWKIEENRILSYNYIIEFRKEKGSEDE